MSDDSDIIALKHVSRIIGHCINPALFVSHFQASIWALNRRRCHTHKPDRKALLDWCNVRESYWRAIEPGCLVIWHDMTTEWQLNCPLFAGDTNASHQLRSKGDRQERDASGNPPPESGTLRSGGVGGSDGIVVADVDGQLGGTPRALSLPQAATLPNLHLRPCKH